MPISVFPLQIFLLRRRLLIELSDAAIIKAVTALPIPTPAVAPIESPEVVGGAEG